MTRNPPNARQLWISVGLATSVMFPALTLRIEGWRPNPALDIAVFGVAIRAAGSLLPWGAGAVETCLPQGPILSAPNSVAGGMK